MSATRILLLLSATLWGTPGLAAPVVVPLPACTCKIQPSATIITSWAEIISSPTSLSFYPDIVNYSPLSSYPSLSSDPRLSDHRIAEGPPPDDKGTPGSRGQCRYNQCTSYQSPPNRNPASSGK